MVVYGLERLEGGTRVPTLAIFERIGRARRAAVTLGEFVGEYVCDPRWERDRALYVAKEALRVDELGPARGRARRSE